MVPKNLYLAAKEDAMKLSNIQILIVRLALAGLFLHLGISKIDDGWLQSPEKLLDSLNNIHQKASGMHLWYLDSIAIPYASLWSKLMAIGESALGLSLLFGLLARLSSSIAIFMLLNFHAANGMLYSLNFFGSAWAGLLIASFVVIVLARGGRWLGTDALLAKAYPSGILW